MLHAHQTDANNSVCDGERGMDRHDILNTIFRRGFHARKKKKCARKYFGGASCLLYLFTEDVR